MNFTPGFITVLHTFGRDLKWNPHIHRLISEGGYSDIGFWRNMNHFNEHKERFYVYARPNKCDPKTVVKYIGRYLGRPVIATSRKSIIK